MRNLVVQIEATEPAICQMQSDFLRQSALRAQSVAVVHNQHPDHQFGINGWPTDLAIVGLKPLVNIRERRRHKTCRCVKQMILWNALIEPKLIKQTPLLAPPPHHRRLHGRDPCNHRNHCSVTFSTPFSTASTLNGPERGKLSWSFARVVLSDLRLVVQDHVQ
jgi:hypothetical protein